jgi:uncharacterized membrane protein
MAATVAWLGGLFYQAAMLLPAVTRESAPARQAQLLEAARRWFDPLVWLSLAILIATGLTQMTANPYYEGFLRLSNQWSAAILVKHIVIGLMVIISAYQMWVLQPELARLLLLKAHAEPTSKDPLSLLRLQIGLMHLNLAFGVVVLGLTAIARTA